MVPLLGGLLEEVGDVMLFALEALAGTLHRAGWVSLMPVSYSVGVRSAPAAALTGLLVGMILAVQTYGQFHAFGLETHLGGMIGRSVVRELAPLLVAVVLVAQVGNLMASELAALRATDQLDALAWLGADPVRLLVTPRLLACLLMGPVLTVLADWTGILGGALVCVGIYGVDGHFYRQHSVGCLELWDLGTGLVKAVCFSGALAVNSCYRGFHAAPGPEWVTRSATHAGIASIGVVLVLDFFLDLFLNALHAYLWPTLGHRGGFPW